MENLNHETASTGDVSKASVTHYFNWIENEGLLRDEGVICGLAGIDPAFKIASIENYYEEKKNYFLDRYNKLIDEINLKTGEKSKCYVQELPITDVVRNGAGLIAVIATCVFAFFIIYDLVELSFSQPVLISLGIYAAGMFGLFTKFSFFYKHDTTIQKQQFLFQILLEVGLPVTACVYVVVHAYERIGLTKSIAAFFFILFVFLFSGKLLLSIVGLLQSDVLKLRNNMNAGKLRSTYKLAALEKINQLEAYISSIESRILELNEVLSKILSQETLEAKKVTRINIFLSEYHLAKGYKESIKKENIILPTLNGAGHG